MCKSMTDFEKLVMDIQSEKKVLEDAKARIKKMEDEVKAYMTKRQKEELPSKSTGLVVSYKMIETPKFNKELYIKAEGEESYKKYLVVSKSKRLNFLKAKA